MHEQTDSHPARRRIDKPRGVETWLMHVLRHSDREQFQLDFLAHTSEPCADDDGIRTLGSRIIPCLTPDRIR